MSTISASTTSTTAYKVTADTTGTLVFQTGATPTTALTIGSDQSVTFAGAQTYTGGATFTSGITVQGITVGKGAGAVSTNTAVGASALAANTTGDYITAVGTDALKVNTTGVRNTAVGRASLTTNTTGGYNSAFGMNSLYGNSTGSYNTAVGQDALTSNTTANYNTALGYQAGYSFTGGANAFNTYVGPQSGYSQTSGTQNTFVGYAAGYSMTTGSKNVILGTYNGNQGGLDIRTASNYIVLSDGDGNPRMIGDNQGRFTVGTTSVSVPGFFNSYSNTGTSAGRFVGGPSAGDGSIMLLVDKYTTTNTTSQWFLGFTVNNQATASGVITANGASQAAFGSWSDRRLKENIVDLPPQLDNIMALRPVEFDYIESEGGGHQISFIAQEFEEVYPDAIGERPDGMKTLTGWSKTEARLVKAIQELKAELDTAKAQIAALQGAAQ